MVEKNVVACFFFLQNGKPSSTTSLVFPVLYQVQKAFGKYGWKIKKNTTFWVVPVENLLEKRKIGKGSPVLPDGMLRMEIPTACSFSSKQERIKLYTLRFKAIFDNGKGT